MVRREPALFLPLLMLSSLCLGCRVVIPGVTHERSLSVYRYTTNGTVGADSTTFAYVSNLTITREARRNKGAGYEPPHVVERRFEIWTYDLSNPSAGPTLEFSQRTDESLVEMGGWGPDFFQLSFGGARSRAIFDRRTRDIRPRTDAEFEQIKAMSIPGSPENAARGIGWIQFSHRSLHFARMHGPWPRGPADTLFKLPDSMSFGGRRYRVKQLM